MFCIVCGSSAEADNFCSEHYAERHALFETENFSAIVCPLCGSGMPTDEDILSHVTEKGRIKSRKIIRKQVGNRIVAKLLMKGFLKHGIPKEEEHSIMILLRKQKCELCVKMSGGYYEAVMQLRGERKEKILQKLEALATRDDITSIESAKEGYNVKFVSKKKAATISGRLSKNFSVNSSYKLVAEKKGKKLYRNFYAIR